MNVIEWLKVLLLGIVEGITEWLPISSTGHMILVNEFIHLNVSDAFMEMFLVVIQLGAILAVVVLYFGKLWPFTMPSKGWIKESAQADLIPPAYETAGASALSILTDEKFFGGTLRDIRTARPLVNIPILRKDFIIDKYQLLQARIVGADAVLLIAACLTPDECHTLTMQAHELGLEVLLEVHSISELSYIYKETDMIGVNNRNLGSFVTNIENSFRIAEELKNAVAEIDFQTPPLLVSESGISHPETIRELRSAGFRGFLMGETFMRTDDPGSTLEELIHGI